MRIAACFTGRITTWEKNVRGIMDMIKQSFEHSVIDYYMSLNKHSDCNELINLVRPVKFHISKIEPNPGLNLFKQKMISGLYHKWKVIQLIKETEAEYDWVIFIRCDYLDPPLFCLNHLPVENTLYVPVPSMDDQYTLNRIPDHLDAGSLKTMETFAEIYTHIHKYIDIDTKAPEEILYQYFIETCLKLERFIWFVYLDPERGGYGCKNETYD